jgi:hypothetical protein
VTTNTATSTPALPSAARLAEPYVGPRPFEKGDAPFFFGRDSEAYELMCRIVANAEVLLYAQSGAGKTSLINARLLPLLRKEGCELLPLARVHQLVQDVRAEDVPNLYVFHTLVSWAPQEDPRSLVGKTLEEFLRARARPAENEDDLPSPRVVIFDQFEELFTAYPERWKERKGFFEQIRAVLKADSNLRVVFSMREDHIAALDPYVRILPEKLRIRFRLERLRREGALAAVKKPLERLTQVRRTFAEGVAERLVDNLLQVQVRTEAGTATAMAGEYVEAVQLQVACQTLWQNLPANVTEITEAELQNFGDVNQALARYYERALQTTVQEKGVREGKLRRWFSEVLITPAGTRGLVYRGDFETAGMPNEVLDDLEGVHHLLRGEDRAGAHWYELSHDRFIRPIREANQKWFDQRSVVRKALLALEARAQEFQTTGHVLSAEELPEAERWASSPEAAEVGFEAPLVLPLLQASRAAVEGARRGRRRLLAAVAVAGLFIAVACVWAYTLWVEQNAISEFANQQERQRARYKLELDRHLLLKEARNLLSDVESLRSDPSTGISNVLDAERLVHKIQEKAPNETDWPDKTLEWLVGRLKERRVEVEGQIEKSLREAILASRRGMVVLNSISRARQVEFSSDGKRLVVLGDDRKVSVWDTHTGQNLKVDIPAAEKSERNLPGPLREVAVSGGERPIAVLLVATPDAAGAGSGAAPRRAKVCGTYKAISPSRFQSWRT